MGQYGKINMTSPLGEWSTGIEVIDNDKALSILNEEAEKEYSSLYFFDNNGVLNFDSQAFETKKRSLLSLIQTIILRVNNLCDGTFEIIDEVTEKLQ